MKIEILENEFNSGFNSYWFYNGTTTDILNYKNNLEKELSQYNLDIVAYDNWYLRILCKDIETFNMLGLLYKGD